MLFDPKWEQQTKADPLTLESLIAWLEKQNPETEYEFLNCFGGCLIGRYLASLGTKYRDDTYVAACRRMFGPDPLSKGLPNQEVPAGYPRTFGAALERARAALATAK